MALDAATIAALVNLISTQGEAVVFVDPNRTQNATREWEVDEAPADIPGNAYIAPVENNRIDGETVRLNDSVAYVHAPDGPADFNDEFRIRRANGDEYQVIDISTYHSGGVAVLHEIVIRT